MFTAAASASSCVDGRIFMWPAFSDKKPGIVIAGSPNRARKCAVKTCFLFSFDLHHSGVMNDDLDRPKSNPFQGEQDGLLDSPI
jgi:hypothetical protein